MSAGERWRQVDGIVEAALELEAAERPGFVARACGDDSDLRREVESLLAHDRADGFLEVPAADEAARAAAAADPHSLVGKSVGRFEVLERIGTGGMGEVYLARDARLQRRVAIKRLPEHLSGDAERVRRFRQEALATSALNHPNIVTVHEIIEHEGGDLLVTELVDGITLRERLRRGPMPLAAVLDVGLQAARGLAAAHAIGIVHRDVKPDNVMIRSDGLVKVLDFGIAKSTRQATDLEEGDTGAGSILGTVGYMSPEQARGLAVDARTDVWSLGVVLYELATGETPFPGPNPTDRLASILERDPLPPSRVRPGLPDEFDRLVMRVLAKDPAGRPADAAGVASALESLAAPAAATGGLETRALETTTVAARWPRRPGRRAAVLLGAAAVLAAASAAAIRYHGAQRTIDSLAVLPFENRTNDPDAEYLGDGLTESLIDQISRLPSLRVMARATVFQFKGTSDPVAAGRRLGVGAVLTGTVSRRGDRLLVSAELVQTATGLRLWGDSYDRPVADLQIVQDSIAADIATRLRPRLSREERLTLARHGTDDPEAYDLFLKAGFWLAKDTEEGDLEARRLCERAAARDPRFLEPYLALTVVHGRGAVNGYVPPSEAWPRLEAAALKALELDPGNIAARAQRVNRVFFHEWDFARVEREYREMTEDPRVVFGRRFSPVMPISMFLFARGFHDEAASLMEKALESDPGNAEMRSMRADFLARAGRLDEAATQYEALTGADPGNPSPWFGLAEVLKRKGELQAAIGALRKAYEGSGETAGTEALSAARTEQDYERAEEAVARARLAEHLALAQERYISPLSLARLRAQAGDRAGAFTALAQALAERSPGLVFLKVDTAWDGIRDDGRFAEIVRRVGIP